MNRYLLFLLFIGWFGGFVLSSCSKSQNTDEEVITTEFDIKAPDSAVKPMQIVKVLIVDKPLTNDTYKGKVNTTEIIYQKISPTELLFIVPDLDPGIYKLKCVIDGKTISTDLQIQASALIDDAEMYVGYYVNDALANYVEVMQIDSLLEPPVDMLKAKEAMQKAELDFRTLSDKDKMKVALFLQNNQKLIDDVEAAYSNFIADNSTENMDIFEKCLTLLVAGTALIQASSIGVGVVSALVVTEIAFRIFTGNASPVFRKVKSALTSVFNITFWPQNYLAEATFDETNRQFSNFFNDKKWSGSLPEINFGEQISFKIKPWFRSINSNDVHSPEITISNLVNAYNTLSSMWTSYFSEAFGALPSFVDKIEQKYGADIADFSVHVTSNSENVSAQIVSGSSKYFIVEFNSQSMINQNFDFEITYSEKGVVSKTLIHAFLIKPEYNTWLGNMVMTTNYKIDPLCECTGTGGCQACKRGLFGSSWGTSCPIAFAYSSVVNTNNFKQVQTVGGNITTEQVVCYTSNISKNQNFIVQMNGYAPGNNTIHLNDVYFEITEETPFKISGTWYTNNFEWSPDQCLEYANGTWEVNGTKDPLVTTCNVIPHNP